jgi:hypothetical protein
MPFYKALALSSKTRQRGSGGAQRSNASRGQALQTISYEDVLRDKVIVRTPESVTKRLQELIGTLGLNGVLAEPIAAVSLRMKRSCARCSSCASKWRLGSGRWEAGWQEHSWRSYARCWQA